MRIHQAVSPNKLHLGMMKESGVKNILTSFMFTKSRQSFERASGGWYPESLILDSGAFSVWTKGLSVDIDKYANFCLDMRENIPKTTTLNIVNLDVLPGRFGKYPTKEERQESVKKGWENMLYLESKGLKPIPVFHQHEDFEWLKKMISHTDYIGISPANDVSMKEKLSWLDKAFFIVRNKVKTHGFAVTAYDQLIRYPFYSVDSSTWAAGGKWGNIPYFYQGKVASFRYKNKKQLLKNWHKLPPEYKDVISNYNSRDLVGIKAFCIFEDYITKLWSKRGINY